MPGFHYDPEPQRLFYTDGRWTYPTVITDPQRAQRLVTGFNVMQFSILGVLMLMIALKDLLTLSVILLAAMAIVQVAVSRLICHRLVEQPDQAVLDTRGSNHLVLIVLGMLLLAKLLADFAPGFRLEDILLAVLGLCVVVPLAYLLRELFRN